MPKSRPTSIFIGLQGIQRYRKAKEHILSELSKHNGNRELYEISRAAGASNSMLYQAWKKGKNGFISKAIRDLIKDKVITILKEKDDVVWCHLIGSGQNILQKVESTPFDKAIESFSQASEEFMRSAIEEAKRRVSFDYQRRINVLMGRISQLEEENAKLRPVNKHADLNSLFD